jgi:type IV secretory pathway VirB2 component (pilin)
MKRKSKVAIIIIVIVAAVAIFGYIQVGRAITHSPSQTLLT